MRGTDRLLAGGRNSAERGYRTNRHTEEGDAAGHRLRSSGRQTENETHAADLRKRGKRDGPFGGRRAGTATSARRRADQPSLAATATTFGWAPKPLRSGRTCPRAGTAVARTEEGGESSKCSMLGVFLRERSERTARRRVAADRETLARRPSGRRAKGGPERTPTTRHPMTLLETSSPSDPDSGARRAAWPCLPRGGRCRRRSGCLHPADSSWSVDDAAALADVKTRSGR